MVVSDLRKNFHKNCAEIYKKSWLAKFPSRACVDDDVRERGEGGVGGHRSRGEGMRNLRRRENMVGVNMVLAEYNKIQTWLS